MSAWFNYVAAAKILIFGLLLGAMLPALFAVGVRVNVLSGAATGAVTERHRARTALSWLIIAVVLVVAVIGVLFVARDFIGHHTGWYILGANHK